MRLRHRQRVDEQPLIQFGRVVDLRPDPVTTLRKLGVVVVQRRVEKVEHVGCIIQRRVDERIAAGECQDAIGEQRTRLQVFRGISTVYLGMGFCYTGEIGGS